MKTFPLRHRVKEGLVPSVNYLPSEILLHSDWKDFSLKDLILLKRDLQKKLNLIDREANDISKDCKHYRLLELEIIETSLRINELAFSLANRQT